MSVLFILSLIGIGFLVLCLFPWKEGDPMTVGEVVMTKAGSLVTALICLILMIIFYAAGVPICGTVFLFAAIAPAGIWFHKFNRDQKIATESQAVREVQTVASPQIAPPTERSPGVGQYFVPDPHPYSRNR